MPITRDALITAGNELRARAGPGVLAERCAALITSDRAVIISIRNPAEIAALRRLDGFVLVSVDAPSRLRYEREVARGREGGVESYEAFLAREERENSTRPEAQQLDTCIAQAEHEIVNDGSLEELRAAVLQLLDELGWRAKEGSA